MEVPKIKNENLNKICLPIIVVTLCIPILGYIWIRFNDWGDFSELLAFMQVIILGPTIVFVLNLIGLVKVAKVYNHNRSIKIIMYLIFHYVFFIAPILFFIILLFKVFLTGEHQ